MIVLFMLKRSHKELFYILSTPFMRLNSLFYKYFLSRNKKKFLKLHLGPGKKNYMEGWVNIDANIFTGKSDLWLNLIYPLPFNTSSVDYCYSHHMVEHLPDLKSHFNDIFKILKPGGIYRFGGPNGDEAIKKFLDNDYKWFSNNEDGTTFPDNRKSIGGRFENFIFCRNEHLTILTFSYLSEILDEIGFINIKKYLPTKETSKPEIFNQCFNYEFETDFNNPKTLIIETHKPK